MLDTLIQIDKSLFLFLNTALANPVFDVFFKTITNGRNWIIPGVLGSLIFLWKKKKEAGLVILLALLTVSISDPFCFRVLKPLFARLRPCNLKALVDGGRFLLGHKTSYAFPSAHSMNWHAQAMLLTLFYPKLWIWFFSFAAAVGFSRIYVGVHYPADVLAGAFFGMATAAFVFWMYRLVRKHVITHRKNLQER